MIYEIWYISGGNGKAGGHIGIRCCPRSSNGAKLLEFVLIAIVNNIHLGASWEGFALEQILQVVGPIVPYFRATHSGAEVDLFFSKGGKRYGVAFKFNEAPTISRSMRIALNDLKLSHLYVIYPGTASYPVAENISVVSLADAGNGYPLFVDEHP